MRCFAWRSVRPHSRRRICGGACRDRAGLARQSRGACRQYSRVAAGDPPDPAERGGDYRTDGPQRDPAGHDVRAGCDRPGCPHRPPAREQPVPKPRTERLYNPVVTAAGLIKARGRDIRLAGIAAPDFEVRCGEGTAAWPCGRMARAALRRFVRGRAIECIVPAGAAEIPDPAECRVAGGEDLAAWLVAQGWARANDATYEALEAKAREEKLGLWAEARPS